MAALSVITSRRHRRPTGTWFEAARGRCTPRGARWFCGATWLPRELFSKQTAASPQLHIHRGPAVVFRDRVDLFERIDDPELPVTPDSILVLKHAGPVGVPGMPEGGNLPVPKKLLQAGCQDVVRISDGRMSGTAYGTVVLHIAPEAAVGGPLAFIHDGDLITLDVPRRRLTLEVSESEYETRRAVWQQRPPPYTRGYGCLFLEHVL